MNVFTSAYDDACSRIGLAARNGLAENLRELLSKGCDYAVKDNRGWFPMHEASYNGHLECVKLLLDAARKDCESADEILESVFPSAHDKSTPLSLAASKGHWEIIKVLGPIYAECKHEIEGFPLHKACEMGCLKSVQAMIEFFPHLINTRDVFGGKYPLHVAVEEGNVLVSSYLLQNHAHVNVKDLDDGKTSLCMAVYAGSLEMVTLLVNHGSDVNIGDTSGCTPLYLAAQQGRLDIVNVLLEHKADASIGMLIEGNLISLPISVAAVKGHLEIVNKLIAPTKIGNPCDTSSAVTLAALFGQADCLRILLNANFSAFSHTAHRHRRLRWQDIIENEIDNLSEIIQILVDYGTVINEVIDILEVVINRGKDITVIFLNSGLTELQYLCQAPPQISRFMAMHKQNQEELLSNPVKYRNYFHILLSNKYMPYVALQRDTGTTGNVYERQVVNASPVQVIPCLSDMCRWSIRCLLVRRFGVVNSNIISKLRLPRMVNEFLLYKS